MGVSRAVALAATSLLAVKAAAAEQLQVLSLEFQPLIEAVSGRIDVCALHFAVAGVTTAQRALSVQGTINTTYFADKIPSVLIKVVVVEATDGALIRRAVKSAVIYDNDTISTKDFKRAPSEDGKAYMAWSEFTNAEAAFTTLQEKMIVDGVWLSFNLGEKPVDYTLQIRSEQNWAKVLNEIYKCNEKGLEQIQRELQ